MVLFSKIRAALLLKPLEDAYPPLRGFMPPPGAWFLIAARKRGPK
jgi:hypothetical protein